MLQLVSVSPRQAAALHRLLSAYVVTEEGDPGLEDLRALMVFVERLEQDHSLYVAQGMG